MVNNHSNSSTTSNSSILPRAKVATLVSFPKVNNSISLDNSSLDNFKVVLSNLSSTPRHLNMDINSSLHRRIIFRTRVRQAVNNRRVNNSNSDSNKRHNKHSSRALATLVVEGEVLASLGVSNL